MSVDHDCSPEIAALIGASAALAISDIPWNGPVGARQGRPCGRRTRASTPTPSSARSAILTSRVVSTGKKVVMIEAGANEVDNDTMYQGHRACPQREPASRSSSSTSMVAEIGKPKFDYPHASFNQELFDKIVEDLPWTRPRLRWIPTTRTSARPAGNEMIEHCARAVRSRSIPRWIKFLDEITYKFQKKIVKALAARRQARRRPSE